MIRHVEASAAVKVIATRWNLTESVAELRQARQTTGRSQVSTGESRELGAKISTSPDIMLVGASWYAHNGFPVFPIHSVHSGACSCGDRQCPHPGKHPRTPHGLKDATKDTSRLAEWWRQWPEANIAIPTGVLSGLLVVDIDPRNGGPADRAELVERFGAIPETAESITGGGGRHIYFRYAGGSVPKKLEEGVDLKGDGGYVVAPPSVHASGNPYTWDGLAGVKTLLGLAEPPLWLTSRIARSRDRAVSPPTTQSSEKWGAGVRNDKLASVAGTMRRPGMSHEAIQAALLAENLQRCDPPLSEAEVRRIAQSVATYKPAEEAVIQAALVEDWTQPMPFGRFIPKPIPPACIPSWLGDMARAIAETTETPFDLAALLATAIASACISSKAHVSPEDGYSEPVNILTCPAMESGNRKTAVFTKLMEPFQEWEQDRIRQIEPERTQLAGERRTAELRIEWLRKKVAGSDKPAEELIDEIYELEAQMPLVPPSPRLYADDCTPERLATLMAEQGGRIAVLSDEGGIFDLLAGRYSNGIPNLDVFLKGHSVSSVRVDRADRTRPPILLDRPHLTVGISPQPDILEKLRDVPGFRGRGLLARFLYGLPKSCLGYRKLEPQSIPPEVSRRYRAGIRDLLNFTPENSIRLSLNAAGYRDWKEFQRAVEVEFRDGGKLEQLKDWGSKLSGAALRLAGIFHAVEQAGRAEFDSEIRQGTLLMALDLAGCLSSLRAHGA